MYVSRRAVDDRRDPLDIRFPHTVAASVGMADFNTERNAFSAIYTFSHLMIIPFVIYQAHMPSTDSALNNNRTMYKMQVKNQETANNPAIIRENHCEFFKNIANSNGFVYTQKG